MAQVTAFTAERMKEIEDTTVVGGLIDVNGNLLLTTREGTNIDAGHVKGEKGDEGDKGEDGIEGSAALPAGTISLWASDVAPTNWLICDGSAVSRTEYPSLFEAIGIKYGVGDGVNTFNLPNLKGRTPVGKDAAQTEFADLAQIGGEKAHLLSIAEMPAHNHTFGAGQTVPVIMSGASSYYWNAPTGPDRVNFTGGTANTGGGTAHNILQPYTVVNFIIKVSNGDTPGDSQLTDRVSELEANFSSTPAGTMTMWPSDVAPSNWLICDGSAVSRTTYASLFAAIGVRYGAGDSSTTFNLPNLKGRTPTGLDTTQTEFNALGKTGGTKAHTHQHMAPQGMANGNLYSISPESPVLDQLGSTYDYVSVQNATFGGGWATGAVGLQQVYSVTSSPSGTLPPYQVVNYIIKFTNGDTKGDSQLTQRVSALEGGSAFYTAEREKMNALRAVFSGGGIRKISTVGVGWSQRFIMMGTGVDSLSPGGYYNVDMPPNGTVVPIYNNATGGPASVTVANGKIPIPDWHALYYNVPVGSSNQSGVPTGFFLMGFEKDKGFKLPATAVLICTKNVDDLSPLYTWGDGRSSDPWKNLGLANGWVNYDSGGGTPGAAYAWAAWRFSDDGKIQLKGLIAGGSIAMILSLPGTLAPQNRQIFTCGASSGLLRVDVVPVANMELHAMAYLAGGSNGYVDLADVSWYPMDA